MALGPGIWYEEVKISGLSEMVMIYSNKIVFYRLFHFIVGSLALMFILTAKSKICWHLFFQIEYFIVYGNHISIRSVTPKYQ